MKNKAKQVKTLNILGYMYRVLRSKTMYDMRECRVEQCEIVVNTRIKDQQLLSTTIHESLHAIDHHMQIGLKETQVLKLETALFQFLTSNGVDLSPLVEIERPVIHMINIGKTMEEMMRETDGRH
jgi:hypothetical protein